jgi:hypothetical protein
MGWTNERKLGVGACLVVVVGAFLPWAKLTTILGSLTKSGIDGGDGWISAGAAALSIIAFTKNRRGDYIGAMVLGLLAAAVGLYDVVDISKFVDRVESEGEGLATASVGVGLWMTFFGSLAVVVMAFVCFRAAGAVTPPLAPPPPDGAMTPSVVPPASSASEGVQPPPSAWPTPAAPITAPDEKQPAMLLRRYAGLAVWAWICVGLLVAFFAWSAFIVD